MSKHRDKHTYNITHVYLQLGWDGANSYCWGDPGANLRQNNKHPDMQRGPLAPNMYTFHNTRDAHLLIPRLDGPICRTGLHLRLCQPLLRLNQQPTLPVFSSTQGSPSWVLRKQCQTQEEGDTQTEKKGSQRVCPWANSERPMQLEALS